MIQTMYQKGLTGKTVADPVFTMAHETPAIKIDSFLETEINMSKKIIVVCSALAFVGCVTTSWATEPVVERAVSVRVIAKIGPRLVSKLIVSPDGMRVAFIVGVGGRRKEVGEKAWDKYAVVVDGKESAPYDGVGLPFFSPDRGLPFFSPDSKRVAYITRINNEKFIVVEGSDGKRHVERVISSRRILGLQFSPDSKRVVYMTRSGSIRGPSYIVVGGQKSKPYANVYRLVFSPNSKRVAYIAHQSEGQHLFKKFIVIDGQEGKHYRSGHELMRSNLVFSPSSKRLAYTVEKYSKPRHSFVVLDGKEGTRYNGIRRFSITFSPNSKSVAYVAHVKKKETIVVDGIEGKHYLRIVSRPFFSPDSKQLAYVAEEDGKMFVVVNGLVSDWLLAKFVSFAKEGKRYDAIQIYAYAGHLLFSPDSKRLAYIAQNDGNEFVVLDKKEGKPHGPIRMGNTTIIRIRPTSLTFSPDSKRFAYATIDTVFIDGKAGKRYYQVCPSLQFSPDSKRLAYMAKDGNRQFVVLDDNEGVPYFKIIGGPWAGNARHAENNCTPEMNSLRFNSSTSLHYLVLKDRRSIFLAEEKLK